MDDAIEIYNTDYGGQDMAFQEPRYLSQTVDFLGFLEAKLRDLRGIATLAYEMIQNADDVRDEQGGPGATYIAFDVRDDALVVENNGVFRDVDFERMRNIASGAKREEEGTTGAFGIGFIAVYQVTDHPEIISSGRRWIIRPEAPMERRIEERPENTTNTRFRLPWAFDAHSEVRQKLRLDPVKPEKLDSFAEEIGEAVALAALFLKQIRVLEVKRNGRLVRKVQREQAEQDKILVQDNERILIWNILRGSFADEAQYLREQFPHIESKRSSDVLVAIPDEHLPKGRLFAVLPTETTVPLPFHINADFFPTTDRKRIIFGGDYQSEWNRAAIRAAARALACNLDNLRELLGPEGLWKALRQIKDCAERASKGEYDEVFGNFWDTISPTLSERRIVYTTKGEWVSSREARLLESKEEQDASSILEELDIKIVHADLRPYYGLLRSKEVGTPLLRVHDVAKALEKVGLVQETPLHECPPPLRTREAWDLFWRALDKVWERSSAFKDRGMLDACSIAMRTDETLCLPTSLYRGDEETQTLFPEVPWLADIDPMPHVLRELVTEFSVSEAIGLLEQVPPEKLEDAWKAGTLDLSRLYNWFESHRSSFRQEPALKERLCALPIWPSAEHLHPLTELYLAGDFQDPLGLSTLIDVNALGGRSEFLKDLGVRELTFATYVRDLPHAFAGGRDVAPEKRRDLIRLLARKLSEIQMLPDREVIRDQLSRLPLIECTDGQFRPARQTYVRNEYVEKILGDRVPVAVGMQESEEGLNALYEWLGGASYPRPEDIVQVVREVTNDPPNEESVQTIEDVFAYLVKTWSEMSQEEHEQYAELKRIAWLPGDKDPGRWYRPAEVFAVYQKHLFETQAIFLRISRNIQNVGSDFVRFLGIQIKPSVDLVVKHLIECSEQSIPVNTEVYRFLNDHWMDDAIVRLRDMDCLDIGNGHYVRPSHVFWGEHPFGRYRYRLNENLRKYDKLLDRLGVRERPEPKDFVDVLKEITKKQGARPLDDEHHAIVINCWRELSFALDRGEISASDLKELEDENVIPDPRRVLNKPKYMFFEDRAGLKDKFPGLLDHNVIRRPPDAWRAMEIAGVRPLSKAVSLEILERTDPVEDTTLLQRIRHRQWLVARVIEPEKTRDKEVDLSVLARLTCVKVQDLVIRYSIEVFNRVRHSAPERVPALWVAEEESLYVVYRDTHLPWSAVARELAYALKPEGEVGNLPSGLKEVLGEDSAQEASRVLDELGYPPLEHSPGGEVPSGKIIEALGETDALHLQEEALPVHLETSISRELVSLPYSLEVSSTPRGTDAETGTIGHVKGNRGSRQEKEKSHHSEEKERRRGIRGRLRTYVLSEAHPDSFTSNPVVAEHRSEVDKAGIQRVLEYERRDGREPKEMPHQNPGYDIESLDHSGNIVRYIEVKSLAGDWSIDNPVALTPRQYETARELGDRFWIYVVERATSDDYHIYPIQNPVKRVNQYLFDDGWRQLAEQEREESELCF